MPASALLGTLAVLAAASAAAPPSPPRPAVFPMAVWYGGGRARAPMLEPDPRAKKEAWRADLEQIRALGFNAIRCWIDWASGEPAPGQYRFDTIDVLLELAEEEGLSVVVQVYMDSAPEWVGRENPDSLFVSSNGQAIRPESSPGYCLDHPKVRARDLAFYEALARRASRSPAFLGFDLWSEPHVINWANPTYIDNPEFCFCPNTVARFRSWLQAKYGSLDALNAAWYRRYASWAEVEPNRLSTILSYSDYVDWKRFIADKLGGDLRARYEAVKRGAPDRVATSHAAGVGLFSSPHYWEGQSDDWTMAAQVDHYGTSFYPKHSAFVDRDVEWRGALLDFARSFGYARGGRGFWIGELQSGFGTIAQNVSPTVTPEDLRIWSWSALARGAKALCYYAWYPMSTGYESGGFGMIRLDGSVTERARAAGALARVVDRHSALFQDARPVAAQVAVVYNPLAHFVGGRQRATAYAGPQGEVAGIERDALLGPYRALFGTNVPLDFVHADHLKAADLAAYKLVVLPYPLMMPARRGRAARVRARGRLARRRGARGLERRARALLGHDPRPGPRRGGGRARGRRADGGEGLGRAALRRRRPARPPSGSDARRTLVRGDARAFSAGRPRRRALRGRGAAAVASSFGKGRTLMLGSYVTAAYITHPDESGPALLRGPPRLGRRRAAGGRRGRRARGTPAAVGPRRAGLRLQPRLGAGGGHGLAARAARRAHGGGPGDGRGGNVCAGAPPASPGRRRSGRRACGWSGCAGGRRSGRMRELALPAELRADRASQGDAAECGLEWRGGRICVVAGVNVRVNSVRTELTAIRLRGNERGTWAERSRLVPGLSVGSRPRLPAPSARPRRRCGLPPGPAPATRMHCALPATRPRGHRGPARQRLGLREEAPSARDLVQRVLLLSWFCDRPLTESRAR
ncbi:MAG: alpha-amylase family protein [Vicinamibacteria bacterium]